MNAVPPRIIQIQRDEEYAPQFIEDARQAERCDWCGRDARRNRKRFCRHCNEIRRRIEELEKLAQTSGKQNFMLDWELRVARAEKEDCIAWGGMVRRIFGQVAPLDLEHWFCMLAKRIARDRNMHYGTATMLGWTFTPAQRQVLAYMFWEIFGAEASHNRKARVVYSVARDTAD